ncbi:MAG: 1-acyl-sn-glycerol-3-phosphate acyltransferase [Gemmatimonadetes bacterium]|nr:1-acyl-sn-glycerol-3-phosphate acyltransferase [Gemmatimonadota bacterium]
MRGPVRLTLLALLTVATIGSWAVLTLLVAPVAGARRAVRRGALRAWGRLGTRILGIRLAVEGRPPAAPFYLVSNHLGYLDILVYAALSPVRFVAKREVRRWPLLGAATAAMGTIFIDREVKRDAVRTLDAMAEAIAQGDGVLVFAEATSTAGHGVLPFRPALLEWAARAGHPVHYASIAYATPPGGPPAHLAVCWWGEMTFGDHLAALARLPWVAATVRFGAAPIAEQDRKRLAGRLHAAVSAQFIPVVVE